MATALDLARLLLSLYVMSLLNDGTIFGLAPRQIEQTSHAEDPTFLSSF